MWWVVTGNRSGMFPSSAARNRSFEVIIGNSTPFDHRNPMNAGVGESTYPNSCPVRYFIHKQPVGISHAGARDHSSSSSMVTG